MKNSGSAETSKRNDVGKEAEILGKFPATEQYETNAKFEKE
jgi:hypothetical protein